MAHGKKPLDFGGKYGHSTPLPIITGVECSRVDHHTTSVVISHLQSENLSGMPPVVKRSNGVPATRV